MIFFKHKLMFGWHRNL